MPGSLDFFRMNNLGMNVLQCVLGEHVAIDLPYEEAPFLRQAFDMTFISLRNLEDSTTFVHNGHGTAAAIALWYIAVESYFARVVKIAAAYKKIDFKKVQSDHICARIEKVCTSIGTDKMMFQKTILRKKLSEFNTFRNALFHAGIFNNKLNLKHTSFSKNPLLLNQVDLIQAADIAVSAMSMFRYVFRNIDIIPTYHIFHEVKKCYNWVSIDSLYSEIILPGFVSILRKHNLATSFSPLPQGIYMPQSDLNVKITPLIRLEQDKDFEFQGSTQKTNIMTSLFVRFANTACSSLPPNSMGLFDARGKGNENSDAF